MFRAFGRKCSWEESCGKDGKEAKFDKEKKLSCDVI